MKRFPLTSIQNVDSTPYPQLVYGKVEPIATADGFNASLSGSKCVYCKVKVKEFFKHNTNRMDTYEWITRSGEKKCIDFYLVDPSTDKRIIINGSRHKIKKFSDCHSKSEATMSSYDIENNPRVNDFLCRHDECAGDVRDKKKKNSIMMTESIILIGDVIAMFGTIEKISDANGNHRYFLEPVRLSCYLCVKHIIV